MRPKILLRNNAIGAYYAGPDQWTDDHFAAAHFKTADHAVRMNNARGISATHLVFAYDLPECLVTVPIAPDLSAITYGDLAFSY